MRGHTCFYYFTRSRWLTTRTNYSRSWTSSYQPLLCNFNFNVLNKGLHTSPLTRITSYGRGHHESDKLFTLSGISNQSYFVIPKRPSTHETTASLEKNYNTKDKKRKTLPPVKIMLISETENVSIVTLDEAKKIAHHRGLELKQLDKAEVKIQTEKQVFKLSKMSDQTPIGNEVKGGGSEGKTNVTRSHKEAKTLIVHDKIGEHDLMSKVKSISKWVQKGIRINVFINSQATGTGDVEKIFQFIEKNVGADAKIFNKQKKGKDIRFQIEPQPTGNPATSEASAGKLK